MVPLLNDEQVVSADNLDRHGLAGEPLWVEKIRQLPHPISRTSFLLLRI
ncbi:MAG TPA: hypothetical protein PKD12_16285 [Nitrospira sp.]|nr:hypothetical protein [Nitrospira sp.]